VFAASYWGAARDGKWYGFLLLSVCHVLWALYQVIIQKSATERQQLVVELNNREAKREMVMDYQGLS